MIRKGYVDTNNGQIHYLHKHGDGIPVICLHQTASSSAMFVKIMECYHGNNVLFALDTPGFGGSFDPIGQPEMQQYGQYILEALNALGIDNFHLFGHHTGASIGMEITLLAAERIKSLAMIAPVILTEEERKLFASIYLKHFEPKADGSHLQEIWDFVALLGGGDPPLDLHHREFVNTARAWEGHIKINSKIWDQDYSALFTQIKCPMLIMCSENDFLWPMFERGRKIRPDVKSVVIGGTNLQTDEVPDEVASLLAEFINEL